MAERIGVRMVPVGGLALTTCLRPLVDVELTKAEIKGRARFLPHGHPDAKIPQTRVDGLWAFTQLGELWRRHTPPGMTSMRVPIYGRPTWDAYTRCATLVRTRFKAKYWWIQEDDVYCPMETLRTCYQQLEERPDVGAVCAPYWWRHALDEPDDLRIPVADHPHIYPTVDGGPWFNYPQDEVFEVAAAGLGACMVRVDALNPDGYDGHPAMTRPLFQNHYINEFGQESQGGDLCFFSRLRTAGWKIVVVPWLRSWHRDHTLGVWFPYWPETRSRYGWDEVPFAQLQQYPEHAVPAESLLHEYGLKLADAARVGECRKCGTKITPETWAEHLETQHPDMSVAEREEARSRVVDALGNPVKVSEPLPDSRPPTQSGSGDTEAGTPYEAPDAEEQPAEDVNEAVKAKAIGAAKSDAAPPAGDEDFTHRLTFNDLIQNAPERPQALNVGWGHVGVVAHVLGPVAQWGWELNDIHQIDGLTTVDLVGPIQEVGENRPEGHYDLVYWNHGPEHVTADELQDCLAACWRLVKPGGELYLGCPDREQIDEALDDGNTLEDLAYEAACGPVTFRHLIDGAGRYEGDEHHQVLADCQLIDILDVVAPGHETTTTRDDGCRFGLVMRVRKPEMAQ